MRPLPTRNIGCDDFAKRAEHPRFAIFITILFFCHHVEEAMSL
jgi:hypothetical protein